MRWLALVARWRATSSATIVKICGDQPRITVWSVLDDQRAALAQLVELASMPVVMHADQRR